MTRPVPERRQAALLDVRGVSLQYASPGHIITALYRVSFAVHAGDCFMVMGHSGCGKSTLLKAIGGFLKPTEGSILLNDEPVRAPGPERFSIWQSSEQLFRWKTVLQNCAEPMLVNGVRRAEAYERAAHWIEAVGLADAMHLYPKELSGGMKMRAAVARAFAYGPRVLLMDEPYAALDGLTRTHLQDELIALRERTGITIVFVTHDIPEAVRLGNRILVLSPQPGQVLAELNGVGHGTGPAALSDTLRGLIFAAPADTAAPGGTAHAATTLC